MTCVVLVPVAKALAVAGVLVSSVPWLKNAILVVYSNPTDSSKPS
jgi:hypothetical protein